jgi:hypothetical protein
MGRVVEKDGDCWRWVKKSTRWIRVEVFRQDYYVDLSRKGWIGFLSSPERSKAKIDKRSDRTKIEQDQNRRGQSQAGSD